MAESEDIIIEKMLDKFQVYWFADFSKLVSGGSWGDREAAKKYLTKYWLPENEYLNYWRPIQDKIFIGEHEFPEGMFQPGFRLIFNLGGCLFAEEDFAKLQRAMKKMGERYFAVVLHSSDFEHWAHGFRMKFPVDISWEELISGNYISALLVEMDYNNYYVFGENELWGKYAASDHFYPFDIYGVQNEYYDLFQEEFGLQDEEYEEVLNLLPDNCKQTY